MFLLSTPLVGAIVRPISLICVCACIAISQQQPSIKGFTLGQPLSEYMGDKYGREEYATACQQVFEGSTTTKEQQKLVRKFKVDMDICRGLIIALRGGRWKPPDAWHYNEAAPTYENGKVIRIDMLVNGTPYKQVLTDMIEQFGKPTREDLVTEEDGLGLTEQSRFASWSTADYYASLIEGERDLSQPKSMIALMTPEEHKRDLEELAKHPRKNVLK